MPCCEMKMRMFEVIKEESKQSSSGGNEELKRRTEDLYGDVKKKLEDHIKALERLRKKLREATSETEREQIKKDIADLEGEIEKYQDMMEEMIEFMKDMERRRITVPNRDGSNS